MRPPSSSLSCHSSSGLFSQPTRYRMTRWPLKPQRTVLLLHRGYYTTSWDANPAVNNLLGNASEGSPMFTIRNASSRLPFHDAPKEHKPVRPNSVSCSKKLDVSWQPELPPPQRFKQSLERYYSARSAKYETEGSFHPDMIQHIVDLADLKPGQRVLDLCTGTGFFATQAASAVGESGHVTAVDFSKPMLDILAAKQASSPWINLSCLHADVESLHLPSRFFDRIVCASALVLLRDIPATLELWRDLLAPNGLMVLDGPASTAFPSGVLLAEAAQGLGLTWPVTQVLGNEAAAKQLMTNAGLEVISFTQKQYGRNCTLEKLQGGWYQALPFLEPATPPDLRDALKQDFIAKTAAWFAGNEVQYCDGTMNFVVVQRNDALPIPSGHNKQ